MKSRTCDVLYLHLVEWTFLLYAEYHRCLIEQAIQNYRWFFCSQLQVMSTDQTMRGEQNHGLGFKWEIALFPIKIAPHVTISQTIDTFTHNTYKFSNDIQNQCNIAGPICLMIENRFTVNTFLRWANHLNSISSITTLCKFSNCVMFIFGFHIRYSIRGAAYQTKTPCFPYSTCMKYFPRTGLFEEMHYFLRSMVVSVFSRAL